MKRIYAVQMAKIRKRIEIIENSDFTNVCVFASLRLFAYLSPTAVKNTLFSINTDIFI